MKRNSARRGKHGSKKPYVRRDDARDDSCNRRPADSEAMNDISWYSKYPNLLVAAGSFPYPYRPGMKLPLGTVNPMVNSTKGTQSLNPTIPGVMALDWIPSIGISSTATDPASVLGKEMYSKVREKYSGSLEVDAPDFVMYVLALDSIFSYIAWLKRLYRVLVAWSPNNYALPDVVLTGMNLDVANIELLRANRTQLWQYINELVLQSRKFTCPATMDLFNRHYWMSDNVYTDEASINSQFYMFNLAAVYRYKEQNMPSGDPASGLEMVSMPTFPESIPVTLNPEALYQFGLNMINALVAWDDAYTINGYLMRAYEGTPQFIVDELPLDQPFTPVYVPEVLMQIENSREIPYGQSLGSGVWDWSLFNVSQDVLTNSVISNPRYITQLFESVTNQTAFPNVVPTLSIRSDAPTVADSVVASRLQCSVVRDTTLDGANGIVGFQIHAGTEIPLNWRVITNTSKSNTGAFSGYGFKDFAQVNVLDQITVYQEPYGTQGQTPTFANIPDLYKLMNTLDCEQFDWHPFVFIIFRKATQYASASSPVLYNESYKTIIVGDTHNITVISADDLDNLHKVCIYSELNSFAM